MIPPSIGAINGLSPAEKRLIYSRLIPPGLLARFGLGPELRAPDGSDLLTLNCPADQPHAELSLVHEPGFPDPILFGHLTDNLNGQLHILLYVINDPASPRFDVDRMPDGRPTKFGILARNIPAERQALEHGLAPGQVRRGLRMLDAGIEAFERFVLETGNDIYFIEPLYYHNAVIFERHGFAYQQGRRSMERIHVGFAPEGALSRKLDPANPFRRPTANRSIRLRSWAIHDGVLGEALPQITMYKRVGRHAGVNTAPDIPW